jgi:hypothetical protein
MYNRHVRFDLLSSFEHIGDLPGEYLVHHIAHSHLLTKPCITLLENRLGIIYIHITKGQIKVLGFGAEERIAAPALSHKLGHFLGTGPWDRWPMVDPRVTNLTENSSGILSVVWIFATVNLVHDNAFCIIEGAT